MLHSRLKLAIQRYLTDDRFKGDIVLLEPREHDANYFAVNPMAFWKRAETVRHGFESVRDTIERNYDQLSEVFARYGLEMSRSAAQEKADAARAERGWASDAAPSAPDDEAGDEGAADGRLRLVGS
jgi:hypothetical protein